MITIKGSDNQDYIVPVTMFPDKTSQVWNLDPERLLSIVNAHKAEIHWTFENEAELVWICQLADLINSYGKIHIVLYCPYLPYGRQDKRVQNDRTFGLKTFITLIHASGINKLLTLDAHSKVAELFVKRMDGISFQSIEPVDEIGIAMQDFNPDYICFPDFSASIRYGRMIMAHMKFPEDKYIIMDKTRDQATGEINGMKVHEKSVVKEVESNARVLQVDDICDGGRTFIGAAECLDKIGVGYKGLYTTHGIYSRGVEALLDGGISHIYNMNGKVSA